MRDLSALEVVWKIQIMSFLQVDMLIHSWFMDLGYLIETIIHYLLIGGITCFSHQDGFFMMSV